MFRLALDGAMLAPALAIAGFIRKRHGAASSAEILSEFQISQTTPPSAAPGARAAQHRVHRGREQVALRDARVRP
jgi:hypothetical protein